MQRAPSTDVEVEFRNGPSTETGRTGLWIVVVFLPCIDSLTSCFELFDSLRFVFIRNS